MNSADDEQPLGTRLGPSFGVIFDVDGVLVDSYWAHFESWKRLAQELDWAPMTQSEFAATFGRTSREVLREQWHGNLSDQEVAQLDARKEEIYRQTVAADFPAMPGARELVLALHEAGFGLAVGSSGPPENVALVLEQLEVVPLFAVQITGRDVTRGKPDPQVFQLAGQRLGIEPCRCLVIEDAAPGIAAARAAGMFTVGLVSTGRTAEELRAADRTVDSLRELDAGLVTDIILRRH